MRSHRSGTAFVRRGEPTATDAAQLRRSMTDSQKDELRAILIRLHPTSASSVRPPGDAG
jgi:hypothetical protein